MTGEGDGGRPWSRDRAALDPGRAALDAFVAAVFPGAMLAGHETLAGGRANTSIRLRFAGLPGDAVLRLYQRDPGQRAKEAALHRRLDGRVPMARLLAGGEEAPVLGGAFAVLSFVAGETLERRLPGLDAAVRRAAGASAGAALAAIHRERFEHSGFLDGALDVALPLPEGPGALGEALAGILDGHAARRLGAARCAAMASHLDRHGAAIAAWPGDACLVHADYGASNILMAGEGAGIAVAAVLDWEFAMAATPLLDLGNLVRSAAGDGDPFVAGIAEGYRSVDPALPADWPALARAVDLLAWADFAGREDAPPDLLDHAGAMIDRILA